MVAVGSYGREELVPQSDIDVLLLHETKVSSDEVARVADSIWYPLWDSGISIDHSVRSPVEVIENLKSDHRVLLGLLDARFLCGSLELFEKTLRLIDKEVRSKADLYASEILRSVLERHRGFGSITFDLEPNLKESAGGTRDVAILRSLINLEIGGSKEDMPYILGVSQRQILLREWLYRVNPKAQDRLSLFDQSELASRLGAGDVSKLMYQYAQDALRISVLLKEALKSASRKGHGRELKRSSSLGVRWGSDQKKEIPFRQSSPVTSVYELLKTVEEYLQDGTVGSFGKLEQLKILYRPEPSKQWSEKDRNAFLALLQQREQLVEVWNVLDASGLWCEMLPEWKEVRFLRRPNAFHRFSVDRHLIESVKVASLLRDRVHRTDLLLFAALLHDLGKAREGDHSEIGGEIVKDLATRLGFPAEDVVVLTTLIENHLLLAEVITRRDLSDPSTVEMVADKIGSSEILELLIVLTEADSIATGVVPWSRWKESLLSELAFKVRQFLDVGVHEPREPKLPPDILEELVAKASSGHAIVAVEDHLYVGARDNAGLFATVVGSLAVSGISVVSADAFEREKVAIDAFRVDSWSGGEPNYQRFKSTLKKAIDDPSFLAERIDRLKHTTSYRHDRSSSIKQGMLKSRVEILEDVSDSATVVEIWTTDRRGVLFDLACEISKRGYDIRHAKILTMGVDVVDTFYIVGNDGGKIKDSSELAELIDSLYRVLGADRFVSKI